MPTRNDLRAEVLRLPKGTNEVEGSIAVRDVIDAYLRDGRKLKDTDTRKLLNLWQGLTNIVQRMPELSSESCSKYVEGMNQIKAELRLRGIDPR